MKRLTQIFWGVFGITLVVSTPCEAAVLIDENFDDISDWKNLSTAITWGNNLGVTSAFTTTGGLLSLTNSAFNYTGYTSANSLKTFTALDRQFSSPIAHQDNTLTIDFRARWNSVESVGSGENGRFLLVLNYDYPQGGLNTNLNDKYDDFNLAWWTRPTYHVRIRAGSTSNTQGTSLLQYGGGFTAAGEYERYNNTTTPKNPDWWLPGFISGAGGTSPGNGPSYPQNSWVKTSTGVATTSLRNYRYVLKPMAQEFWFDANNNGSFQSDELRATMPLPINNSNAPLYQYFSTVEGIRLYWRGAGGATKGQVFLDRLTVTLTATSSSSEASAISVTEPSPNLMWIGVAGVGLLSIYLRLIRNY